MKQRETERGNFTFHFDVNRLRIGAALLVLRCAGVCAVIGAAVDMMQHQRTVRGHLLTSTRWQHFTVCTTEKRFSVQ